MTYYYEWKGVTYTELPAEAKEEISDRLALAFGYVPLEEKKEKTEDEK